MSHPYREAPARLPDLPPAVPMRQPVEAFNARHVLRHEWEPYAADTLVHQLERKFADYRKAHDGRSPDRIRMRLDALREYLMMCGGPSVRVSEWDIVTFQGIRVELGDVPEGFRLEP